MTQTDLDTKQINKFIDDTFSTMKSRVCDLLGNHKDLIYIDVSSMVKSQISNIPMEQKETPQILLFLIRKNIEGTEVYGSVCSLINGTASKLKKQEKNTMKIITEIDNAKILCGCGITYSENELKMEYTNFVNNSISHRVHKFIL